MPAMAESPAHAPRIAWFCDLEMLQERLDLLRRLHDELGLTTLVPESHICHTSGFMPSPEVVVASPVEGWRASPTLRLHREAFGVAEPAFAVLPGVVSGFDDTPLLRVIDECRRVGIEVWGHAGLWCYGGEVFPELAVRDLFGRPLPESSLPWGTPFCPSQPALHAWIKLSLTDVVRRYDLDGFFLDHARYTAPGDGPSLLTCGCPACAQQATARGYDMGAFRSGLLALRATLATMSPGHLAALTEAGSIEALALAAGHRGALDWFIFRARLLADQWADIAQAVRGAAGRPLPFGSDVFPPSVALLGGHLYQDWARGATFVTGGFGGRIGWGTVGTVTIDHLSPWLRAWVPGLDGAAAARLVAHLIGYDHPFLGLRFDSDGRVDGPHQAMMALTSEMQRMAAASGGLPVYPPVSGGTATTALRTICQSIVAAGLAGAMFSGLEQLTAEQRTVVREELADHLL